MGSYVHQVPNDQIGHDQIDGEEQLVAKPLLNSIIKSMLRFINSIVADRLLLQALPAHDDNAVVK